ncbi:MAG TPA: VOC family protein [Symbiobacteriaceae bacterium]|nr:VOC family protein [Symbiobacteriaceae bacterium]
MAQFQRITPWLWFDGDAEAAANFYVSIFQNSRINRITRVGGAGQETHGQAAGSVLTVNFELDGLKMAALNGGPQFKFTEAISLQILCETQEEIDYYWSRLTADGGEEGPCGWLKDRFGLSWQVVPTMLGELLSGPDQAKADRVTNAFLKMQKFDLAALRRAADGE